MKELKVKEVLTNELEKEIDKMIETTKASKDDILNIRIIDLVDYVVVCKQYRVLEVITRMLLA